MIGDLAKRDIKLPATLIGVASVLFLLVWPMLPRTVLVTDNGQVADLSAYVLPDGSLPFLCDGSSGDGPSGGYRSHCPLCTLSKILSLPPRAPDIFFAASFTHVPGAPYDGPAIVCRVITGLGSRGPPSIV